jgi:outer membrane protein TolC
MAAAAQNNPELAAMAHGVAERENALELARLAYLPDFSPQFSIEGNAQQMVGMMVNLPTSLVRIRGQIDESQANLRQSQALLRQGRSDRVSLFVATLYAFRNADRQANLLNDDILPRATQLWQASHQAYSAGSIGFAELIDTQRTLLQVRLLLAEARVDREKRLAELETLAGLDAETIATPTRPTSAPVAKIEQALRPQD